MAEVDKNTGNPTFDFQEDGWDKLSGADGRVAALNQALEVSLIRTEPDDLRSELIEIVQGIPSLFELMKQDARGDRKISLLDHSVDVLEQNFAYKAYQNLPADGFTPLTFAKFLLSHDSGKSLPADKAEAGPYTFQTIESHNDFLNFSQRELQIVRALLSCDPIGRIMHCGVCPFDRETEAQFTALRNEMNGDIPLAEREKIDPRYILKARHRAGNLELKDLEKYSKTARVTDNQEALEVALQRSVDEIEAAAQVAEMSTESFFQLMSVFYQLDVSAYTVDVGIKREVGLEFLMEINPEFLIEEPESLKLFVPDSSGGLPLKFSAAATTCHALLKDQLRL